MLNFVDKKWVGTKWRKSLTKCVNDMCNQYKQPLFLQDLVKN